MKIRIEGAPLEIDNFVKKLKQTFIITSQSKIYSNNTRKDRFNNDVRVYLEVE